jgi:hypothetical protein
MVRADDGTRSVLDTDYGTRRVPNTLGVLAVVLLLGGTTAGRDVFVSNTGGNDIFDGLEAEHGSETSGPVKTIAKALRVATSGDRIVLMKTGKPYRETVSLVGGRLSGYPRAPMVIEGSGNILDGAVAVVRDQWKHYRGNVFRFRPGQTGNQQLFLDGRPAVRVAASWTSGSPPDLGPLQWCHHAGYIYFCVEKDRLPENYNLTYAYLQTGITLYHVEYVLITNLIVQGFQVDGISVANSAKHVFISGVTSRGNGRSGISVGAASAVEIDACLLGNNGDAQLLTLPMSETRVRNSRLLSNTAPAWVDQGGRFYLGAERVEGGREAIAPEDDEPKPEK